MKWLEKNKETAVLYLKEVIENENLEILKDIFPIEYERIKRDQITEYNEIMNQKIEILDVIAENNKVVVVNNLIAAQKKSIMGIFHKNRKSKIFGIGLFKFKEGKIVDVQFANNDLAVYVDLGIIQLKGENEIVQDYIQNLKDLNIVDN
ncbi:MAG: hypothetical protein ACXAD7_17615 [Candidatus Kariarchaeaceae archaeon]